MDAGTVFYANEMNKSVLEPQLQYEFYRNIIPTKKRWLKFVKKNKDEEINFIAEYFSVNLQRAKEYVNILTEEQIRDMKRELEIGGVQ